MSTYLSPQDSFVQVVGNLFAFVDRPAEGLRIPTTEEEAKGESKLPSAPNNAPMDVDTECELIIRCLIDCLLYSSYPLLSPFHILCGAVRAHLANSLPLALHS